MNSSTIKTVGVASAVARALDLIGMERVEPRQPDEFTSGEFASELHLSETQGRRRLKPLLESGKLVRRKTVIGNCVTWLYRPAVVAKGSGKK